MSLYAIGDLHLSFSADKPMDVFGRVWKNHEKKIWKYWNKRVTEEDTIVITGADIRIIKNNKKIVKTLDFPPCGSCITKSDTEKKAWAVQISGSGENEDQAG